ncbi:LexA repressor [Frankliniella fusca]|uniref:LexA repressor n=1 Tax=Frankliniella fusca TaxID=407009 RepID=A0AAE1LA84_9NEOP|nr:LexA repressor [Frankliniella fusca]
MAENRQPIIIQEEGRRIGSFFYHVGDGFYFHFHDESFTAIYFRCHRSTCHGRAQLRLGGEFEHTAPHNHAPDIQHIEVLRRRREIVNQARTLTYMSFQDIIATVRRRIPDRNVRAQLTLRRLRPAMQRARGSVFPRLPQSLFELGNLLGDPVWSSLTQTLDEDDSLWLGSALGADGSCSSVFISSRCLQVMRLVDILFADGTFYITPSINGCYQVFTIVTIHSHTVIPLLWAVMERKTECAYTAVLTLLRTHLINWRFNLVISDFEDAIINAFTAVFAVDVQGCFFHSAHAMALHAKVTIGARTLTLLPAIMNVVRLCCALPLLPQDLVQRGMNLIGYEAMELGQEIYNIVRPYLEYVQVEWLNHPNRGRCLSVYGSNHRTNNASESNNRRMKRRIGTHHPNIFQFISKLLI